MNYKIIIFAEAKTDIKEAAFWHNQKERGLGKRFITTIKNEIAIIKQNPFFI